MREPPNTACNAVDYARLTVMMEAAHPCMRPIWAAVRDRGIGFGVARHSAGAFDFPDDVPNLILFHDLAANAAGPDSFHRTSLKKFARRCAGALVVSAVRDLGLYTAAAEVTAEMRKPVALIETTPEREPLWVARLRAINPGLNVVVNMAAPGEAVH